MQGYYAGFDVGRTFHVLVVVDGVGKRVLKRRVANTFNAVQEAVNRVLSIASGSEVCWAVEMVDNNARMFVSTLVKQGQKVYQTTPYRLKRFKEAGAQPRKSDTIDAVGLANLLRLRRDELTPINILSKEIRVLRNLSRSRHKLSAERTRLINHLQGLVIGYCPDLMVNWPGHKFISKTILRLLSEHPDIASMAELSNDDLLGKVKKFSRGKFGEKHASAIMQAASTLITRDAVCELEAGDIRDAIGSIAMFDARLAEKDELIDEALAGSDVARRLMLLPGISRIVAATIMGEAGNISRFANEGKFATYCGLTPICKQSGISRGSHRLARQTNKRLLNVMYLSAISSIKSFSVSKAYFKRRLAVSGGTHVDTIRAIIALARHRCRIIFNILSRDGYVYKPKQADQPSAAGLEDKPRPMVTHLREALDAGRAFQPAKGHDCGRGACEALKSADETGRWVETDACEMVKCDATALLLQQGSGVPPGEVIVID